MARVASARVEGVHQDTWLSIALAQATPDEMPDAVYDMKTLQLVSTHHAGHIHIKNVCRDTGKVNFKLDMPEHDAVAEKLQLVPGVHRFDGFVNGAFDIGVTPNKANAFDVVKAILSVMKDDNLITQSGIEDAYKQLNLTPDTRIAADSNLEQRLR